MQLLAHSAGVKFRYQCETRKLKKDHKFTLSEIKELKDMFDAAVSRMEATKNTGGPEGGHSIAELREQILAKNATIGQLAKAAETLEADYERAKEKSKVLQQHVGDLEKSMIQTNARLSTCSRNCRRRKTL